MSLIPRGSFFDTDHFFGDFFAPTTMDREGAFFAPRVDVHEKEDSYEISAELPGVKKKDLHVTLDDGVLTLEAETKAEDIEKKEGHVIRQERRYGKFVRRFNLGSDVHEKDITASFKEGVLSLTAPKHKEKASITHRIEVS